MIAFRVNHRAARYSWGPEFPEQHSPFVLGTDLLLDVDVQVEVRAVPEYFDRFRLEHQSSVELNHPNILQDFQLVEEPHRVLLISQQFPGQKLSEVLTDEPLSVSRCLEVLIPVAQAVNYASGYSRVHRLIMPLCNSVASWRSGPTSQKLRKACHCASNVGRQEAFRLNCY